MLLINYGICSLLFTILLVDIWGVTTGVFKLHIFAKLLLIPLMILLYIINISSINIFVIIALLFGWLGDLFLLKKKKTIVFFAIGMFSFLFGHIFYMIVFAMTSKFGTNFSYIYLLTLVPYLIIYILLYFFVFKKMRKPLNLGGMIYFPIVLGMSYMSIFCYGDMPLLNFLLLVSGAHLFSISDIFLVIRQTFTIITPQSPMIMLTYVPAQLLLVLSFIV